MYIRAKKNLGQNFLTDNDIAENIVQAADIKKDDLLWEIGPGKGILTDRLISYDCPLTCFEIDRELIPDLNKKYGNRIELINEDILRVDWSKIIRDYREADLNTTPVNTELQTRKIVLVANIPYNITSPLLEKIINHRDNFRVIVLMIQKEVAERISSLPGRKSYGVLSIKMQHHFRIEALFTVSADKFRPQPNVESMVVRLIPRHENEYSGLLTKADIKPFWRLIETCFHSRRKTLKNNLKPILNPEELKLLDERCKLSCSNEPEIQNKGFNLAARAEALSETDFISLYHTILDIRKHSC